VIGKTSPRESAFDVLNVVLLVASSFAFLYPLWYCIVSSASDPGALSRHEGLLFWPLGYSLAAYRLVLQNPLILRGLANSVFYVVAGVALSLVLTSFAGYALSRRRFLWKKPITLLIIFTMYFSGGLIPTYLLVKGTLHLADTPLALLVPSAINTFYLIIMRTYFSGIPDSMEESAVMDGANDFRILWSIYVPLAMPVVAVLIIYYGIGQWNSWFSASIYIMYNRQWNPLQLILREILTQTSAARFTASARSEAEREQVAKLIKYALIVITVLPIVTIYPFMQRHFIQGVMIGSLKE
jgi:putative aldouronate transport system permease protein